MMAWGRPGDKPLSDPLMISVLTHICVTRPQWVKSLGQRDAYMHYQPWPSLVQIMAFHMFGTKPLSEPMLYHCQFNHSEQTSVKMYLKLKHFHSTKCIWKYRLEYVGHFVLASMCLWAHKLLLLIIFVTYWFVQYSFLDWSFTRNLRNIYFLLMPHLFHLIITRQ